MMLFDDPPLIPGYDPMTLFDQDERRFMESFMLSWDDEAGKPKPRNFQGKLVPWSKDERAQFAKLLDKAHEHGFYPEIHQGKIRWRVIVNRPGENLQYTPGFKEQIGVNKPTKEQIAEMRSKLVNAREVGAFREPGEEG